jgi:hypothetical protein
MTTTNWRALLEILDAPSADRRSKLKVPYTSAPSMEALRGNVEAGSAILFLRATRGGNNDPVERYPIAISGPPRPARERGKMKYQLPQITPVWLWGMYGAEKVASNSMFLTEELGHLIGLSLVIPELQATEVCLGRQCNDCFLWDPCVQGVYPFGWEAGVTVDEYHLRRSFEHEGVFSPKLNRAVPRLVVWGDFRPKEILSFNKDLYLPQTFKTKAEKDF